MRPSTRGVYDAAGADLVVPGVRRSGWPSAGRTPGVPDHDMGSKVEREETQQAETEQDG